MKKSSKSQSKGNNSDDVALFRAAIGEVKPLRKQNRISPNTPSSLPKTKSQSNAAKLTFKNQLASEYPISGLNGCEDHGDYLSNGLSKNDLRKLKRTGDAIQSKLDLHGHNLEKSRELLLNFINRVAQRGLRCVLVIHGKGKNSRNGEAVLRKYSRKWLSQHPNVLAYCDAPEKEGGNGAALVLLKKHSD